MRILVTGAGGQVGTDLVNRGRQLGFDMIATDAPELDITNKEVVIEYIKNASLDVVINAAAYTAVDKAEEEVELAYAINRDGPAHLAAACSATDIPLLHISTDYVFDGAKDGAYLEDDVSNPSGIYGKSKLDGEIAVADTLGEYITLRVAWVFAASGNNFVRTMLQLGAEREELNVVADQLGAPTWSGDIADVLLKIANRYRQGEVMPWGTYHYIGSPVTTWHGFAQAIFDEAKLLGLLHVVPTVHAITTAQYPTLAARPKNSVLDCHKINNAFGISQPDWRAGLISVLTEWKGQ
jgi:dTDP-4-dehydrorhamnose reductase